MKIFLKKLNHTVGCLRQIQEAITASVETYLLLNPNEVIIAFHALGVFNFKKGKYNIKSRESIEAACLDILKLTGIYNANDTLSGYLKKAQKNSEYSPIHDFVKHIIGFNTLPFDIRNELEDKVRDNLRELLALIDEYEKDLVVINYLNGKHRNEHESKVKIDFYIRCITERDTIVKYLATSLAERAIVKARQDNFLHMGLGLKWFEEYWDRPYKWWQNRSIEFFDYRKINLCRHRFDEVPVREFSDFEQLYGKNKLAFYKKIKAHSDPKTIFNAIQSHYFLLLPKLKDRAPIFNELEKHFNGRRWYGFAALALTQVEGIFSDMLYLMQPQKTFSSLSNKVLAIRPYYAYADMSLDYFEYHLPRLRNKFLHSGLIKNADFKVISHDLLYDLYYLMNVFKGLNDPYIELHKMLIQGLEVTGIPYLNKLFGLIEKIKEKYKSMPDEVKDTFEMWLDYEKDTLAKSGLTEYFAIEQNTVIDKKISDFFEQIRHNTIGSYEIDFSSLDMKQISSNHKNIVDTISEFAHYLKDQYFEIVELHKFLGSYKNYLPNCPSDAVFIFDSIAKKHKLSFAKVFTIKEAFSGLNE